MSFLIGLVLDATVMGLILISLLGEFPGWPVVVGCSMVIGIVTNAISAVLPWPASLLGVVAGAATATALFTWLASVDVKRAAKASGIYMGIRLLLSLVL